MEKVYKLEGEVQAEVEGISTAIVARCVNAHGSYDILLGRDWLRKTRSRADFASDIYCLDGSVRVRQRGRQLEVLTPQDSDAESGASDDSSWGAGKEIAEELDAMLAQFGLEKEEIFFEDIHFGSELQPNTVAEVCALCLEYKDCFAKSFLDLETTSLTKLHIELKPGAILVCCGRPRRFAPRELNFMKRQLNMLTRAGLISRWEGDCEWLSGVTFLPKKDGDLRFCCSFVGLNARTVPDKYPLPCIDEILEDLAGHDWYSIFD